MTEIEISTGSGGIEAWIGLIGGLLGALIGSAVAGAISYKLQKREHDRADRLRRDDLLQRQRSIAHRLIVKIIAMSADLSRLHQHYAEQMRGELATEEAEPWTYLVPLFIGVTNIEFDGEETALLLDLGLNDLFNVVGPLPRLHNQHLDVMRTYTIKREQLQTMLPVGELRGSAGAYVATKHIEAETAALRAEMNTLVAYAFGNIDRDLDQTNTGLIEAHRALSTKLSLTFALA